MYERPFTAKYKFDDAARVELREFDAQVDAMEWIAVRLGDGDTEIGLAKLYRSNVCVYEFPAPAKTLRESAAEQFAHLPTCQ